MKPKLTERKWFYPLVYVALLILAMLPPITEIAYDPRNTQDVILSILLVAINPYQAWGWPLHVATILLVLYAILRPQNAGRVMATYFGINYLVIAALQTMTQTAKYGFAIHTGALVAGVLLGIIWLVVAVMGPREVSLKGAPAWRYVLLPLALLVFWSPLRLEGSAIVPDFAPIRLLTAADYGLTYCFTTPVFLFLLILSYPRVNHLAFRVTAFNGLLYGVFNLSHWFSPATRWMGVLHLPLLVIPLVALFLPVLERGDRTHQVGDVGGTAAG